MRRGPLLWSLAAYLFLRWILLTSPGYTFDVQAYKRWALHAARDGLTRVYATSDFDYPPLYAYLLYPLGKLYGLISPEALQSLADTTLLTVLVKLPPLGFDLAIAFLLHRFALGAERGTSGIRLAPAPLVRARALPWRIVLPALYLLHPAVLWDTGYWGQPDSIHSFFVLASFLWVARGGVARDATRPRGIWPAWVFLTLATAMKPLGAPYFPLLLLLSMILAGPKASLVGMGAAALTGLAVLAPFLVSGQADAFLQRLVGDVGAMPYTSVNGHNLWWALGGWRNAEEPWLGPLTPTQVGLGLFGLFFAGLAWRTLHWARDAGGAVRSSVHARTAAALALSGSLGFGFFMLSTHMHENHLFVVIPLFLPLLAVETPARRACTWLWFAIGLGVLLNLALHDLQVPGRFPFTLGGPSDVSSVHMKRPFFVAELWSIRFGTFWNLGLFAALVLWLFRRDGRDLLRSLQTTALVIGLALFATPVARAQSPSGSPPNRPIVLELFTSEGCSSCPAAEAVFDALLDRARGRGEPVIGLAFHVDIWDPLGWEDPFASAEATGRQRRYARQFELERIYTPQLVVDGRTELVGSRRELAEEAIRHARSARSLVPGRLGSLRMDWDGGALRARVEVRGLAEAARILLVVTESGLESVITDGENAGKTLRHRAVVRAWREARVTRGQEALDLSIEVPGDLRPEAARTVILLQDEGSGSFLEAREAPLPSR